MKNYTVITVASDAKRIPGYNMPVFENEKFEIKEVPPAEAVEELRKQVKEKTDEVARLEETVRGLSDYVDRIIGYLKRQESLFLRLWSDEYVDRHGGLIEAWAPKWKVQRQLGLDCARRYLRGEVEVI